MTTSVVFETMSALLQTLSPGRKKLLEEITFAITRLKIPQETSEAVIAVLILEAAESQYVEEGGAKPPPRESTLEIIRPLFEGSTQKGPPKSGAAN